MRLDNNQDTIQLALKDSCIEEVDAIISKLQAVKSGLKDVVNQKHKNKATQKRAIRELGDESLVISFQDKPHQKFKRPPKYQFTDSDGVVKTWWGGGKMPLELKNQITDENGVEDRDLLVNYLIPKDVGQYNYKDKDGNVCFWNGEGTPPNDLQTLLNNGFKLNDFKVSKPQKNKPVFIHGKSATYQFRDDSNSLVNWNPENEEMPDALLAKITVLGQARPELLKKYLVIK
ncbi:hypothetical protein BCT75_04150 [Vibrio lentus]|uniref:hypothetical protein n=1 Tax=Vibrio lentus TaxID=136468 RepID=UPI000C84F086|nr:hypothetical protein [Vibrio lentus]PML45581.1 hypothetical protein BCT75_04150 [Vibrio lentus]